MALRIMLRIYSKGLHMPPKRVIPKILSSKASSSGKVLIDSGNAVFMVDGFMLVFPY